MPVKKRRKLSTYINVRLSEKNDAKLIAWWAALEPSTGGAFVKEAIRAQLVIDNELDHLRLATNGAIVESAKWQDDLAVERAEQTDLHIAELTTQIGTLTSQLASLSAQIASSAFVLQVAPSDNDSPRLSITEQNERLKKVRSQQW